MHSLITGGAGFIGSHLADYLLANGDKVTVLDDFSTGSKDNLTTALGDADFTLVEGTVLDGERVRELTADVDRVFHMAAAVGVRRIIEQPLESLRVNLHGSENVMEAALRHNASVVLMSTSEVYGLNAADSLDEDSVRILGSPLVSRWNYAAAKGLDESFAHAYHREHGLRVAIARLFNTVGPRQTGRYGMVVPTLVYQCLNNWDMTVYGDGTQTRCFSYVGDIVPTLVRLAENSMCYGEVFNLGGAQEISIMNLARRIKELLGGTSEITLVPYEQAYGEGYADMRRRVPDYSRAGRVLGFDPITTVDQIILNVAEAM